MTSSAAAELRRCVDAYFSRHPKETVPSLAKDAKLGASTLRRVLQGETSATFDTACAILSVVCESGKDVFSILTSMFPETAKILAPMVEKTSVDFLTSEAFRENVSGAFRTRAGFLVLCLAAMDTGTTRAVIRRVAGAQGERIMDGLLEKEVIKEENGKISMRSFAHADAEEVIGSVGMIADVFDLGLVGTPGAFASFKAASVNLEGLKLVKAEARKFSARIMEITEDPNFSGELPLAFGAIMSLLDAEALKQGGVS